MFEEDRWRLRHQLATQLEMSDSQIHEEGLGTGHSGDGHSGEVMGPPRSGGVGAVSEGQERSPEGLPYEEVGGEKREKQAGLRRSVQRGRRKAGKRGIPSPNEETASRRREMDQVKCY